MASSVQCPTITPCSSQYIGNGEYRCADGSCTSNIHLCGSENPCPEAAPYLCTEGPFSGQCVTMASLCLNEFGCPVGLPYKCLDGHCAISAATCGVASVANGCDPKTPIKCVDGSCVSDATTCTLLNGCPLLKPFRSSEGECLETPSTDQQTVSCPDDNPVLCADGTCVAAPVLCSQSPGCSVLLPNRCATGSCGSWPHQYPFSSFVPAIGGDGLLVSSYIVNMLQNNVCQPIPWCPPDMPYLCANMQCVMDYSECRPCDGCKVETKYLLSSIDF